MLDPDLIETIREKLNELPAIEELSEQSAEEVINGVAMRYIIDRDRTWWWTSLNGAHKIVQYGENDGLGEVSRMFPRESIAFLVITDDESPPWPVFRGAIQDLLSILQSTRFCEYFISDPDGRWVLFDTHENSLVIAGELAP